MANAIQAIADRFATPEEAAQHFGRSPTWLAQATAAANLSEKVTALLDSGKISSTSAAIQLEKLSKKNEAKAESFIEQIEQLPEGEKISKKAVDEVLQVARGKKAEEPATAEIAKPLAVAPETATVSSAVAPVGAPPEAVPEEQRAAAQQSTPPRNRVNPGKVKLVADLLGLSEDDEEELLARLIDEFLSMKGV
jgi:ParB family chromosome partitioning protein